MAVPTFSLRSVALKWGRKRSDVTVEPILEELSASSSCDGWNGHRWTSLQNNGTLCFGHRSSGCPCNSLRAQDLKDTMKKLLLAFYRANRHYKPERLLFYRDGVSEGQARTLRPCRS